MWGAIEVVAVADYVYDDLKESFRYADDITSADLKSSIYVMAAIVVLWGGGLLGTLIVSTSAAVKYNRVTSEGNRAKSGSDRRVGVNEETKKEFILNYINSVFPVVFQDSTWKWTTVLSEIKRHHPYAVMFTATGRGSQMRRFNRGVYLLSIQTMLMFILSVFYELQYPSDQGRCDSFLTEEECLHDRTVMDQSDTLCKWEEPRGNGVCEPNEVHLSLKAVVLICLAVAFLQAPLNMAVDFLFDIISSPTIDKIKAIHKQSTRSRLKGAMRRASNAIVSSAIAAAKNIGTLATIINWFSPLDSDGKRNILVGNDEVLNLPDSVITSHALVSVNVGESHMRYSTMSVSHIDERLAPPATPNDSPQLPASPVATVCSLNSSHDLAQAEVLYHALTTRITQQRRHFNAESRRYFDQQWGWDPATKSFINPDDHLMESRGMLSCTRQKILPANATIQQELGAVRKEAAMKVLKLEAAADVHIGLEVFQLFICDLLGRDTPAAKIFAMKTEEE